MTIDTNESRNSGEAPALVVAERRQPSVPFRRIGTLSSSKRDPATSESAYLIKATGSDVLQFGEEEYFLWRLLDGANSVADIQAKFSGRFGTALTGEQLDSFVRQLVECGAAERLTPNETAAAGRRPATPEPGLVASAALAALDPAVPIAVTPASDFRLGNPSALLRTLDWICGPLRFFRWLLLPALLVILVWWVGATAASGWPTSTPPWGPAVLALVGVGLGLVLAAIVPPLSQAATASFLGYPTPACRIALRFGFIPRLVFDDAGWSAMLPSHVLITVGAPCLARLVLFLAGTSVWLAIRPAAYWLTIPALAIGAVGLSSFMISAAPFLRGDGRRWLATALGRADPWRAEGGYRLHASILSVFWLAIAAGVLLVVADAAWGAVVPGSNGPPVRETLRWTALSLLVITPVMARVWVGGMVRGYGTLQPTYAPVGGSTALDPGGYPPGAPRALDPGGSQSRARQSRIQVDVATARRQISDRTGSNKAVKIWAILLGLAIAIAFVAYPYEAGGNFTLLPYDSSQLNAQVARPGAELTEVLVNEGDKVNPGQILGILSDWQQKYNLATAKAQLDHAQADLQNLLHSPRPEDVELARKQYEAAMARLPYDKAQFDRYAALVTNDNVTRANYDQVLSQYEQDQAAAAVARANYDQVRAGPTPDQIEAARALVRQDTTAVAFAEDQLERTRIRATGYGTVVTPNPSLLRGKWFEAGAQVFTVEDHRVVQADVQVPEMDIDNVRLGGPVYLRLWSTPETTYVGKSIAIAPDAQKPASASPQDPQSASANVIRVRVEVPNPAGLLRPETDGYAKMAGYHMPVWRAFGQMIERFLLVQIWSWIP
jgi:multidrug resistance efflux pump